MTDLTPTPITSLTQLPPVTLRGIVAATFELALAEYESKYGAAARCWQYGNNFYFEGEKEIAK